MAGPWEKYQPAGAPATGAAAPWEKFKFKVKPADEWERAVLLPMETNKATGERRFAWPQLAVDAGNAIMAPGDAVNGKFNDVYADPNTGAVEPFNPDMMKAAATLSALPTLGGTGGVSAELAAVAAGGMRPAAQKLILRGLSDDRIPVAEIPQRLNALGPDAMLADISPRLQKQAQAIATMPGAGQRTVIDALKARAAARNGRIITDVDTTLGPAAVPSRVISANKTNMDALRPEYAEAFKDARAVDTQPLAEHLEQQAVNLRGDAQKAALRVRQMLDVHGSPGILDPNPYTLFQTRQAIDGLMQTEQNGKALALLSEARAMVDDQLQAAVPRIKQVDAKFAELARQNDALTEGGMLLKGDKDARHPSDVVEQMVSGALPQGQGIGPSAVPFRLSQGARSEIDRLIGTRANDLLALRQAVGGEGDWNRAKLAAVFGKEKADQLLAIIDRELRYISTESDALGGSRTQVLKAAQEEINGKDPAPGILKSLLDFKLGSAAAVGVDKGAGWAAKARRASTNSAVADALISRDRATLAKQLGAGGPSQFGLGALNGAARGGAVEREKYREIIEALLGRGQ